ncbi:MAG: SIS domain-containing protein [Rhodobacterales bacterium]|nr:SIS domain-containing protein [Rhodobacterales bacterium]
MTQDLSHWATWREIHAQPAIWSDWSHTLPIADLRDWIAAQPTGEFWFCGAGTSAYIGDMLVAGLEKKRHPRFRSVPTTDIVSRPRTYLSGRSPLIVSFGRSGNSTETIGTLDAIDALAPKSPRLNITCNPEGALATRPAPDSQQVVLLPEATHDTGFAMTSSFSTMLYTALALFDTTTPAPEAATRLREAASQLSALLPQMATFAEAAPPPERIVFLGTGALAFAARESALKVMELTAGAVPALWDSTLGFRHGPKSFVRGKTDIILLTSPDTPANLYEADLAAELRQQFPTARITTIGPGGDISLPMPHGPLWSAPLAIALAQILAVTWSAALGFAVDDPFAGQGTLSRVVTGVRLHPVTP